MISSAPSSGLGATNASGSDDLAVMHAKLKGDTSTLQLLASRGSFAALAALKEITQRGQEANALMTNAAMNSPQIESVIQQLAGHTGGAAQAPQPVGMAEGGAVDDGGRSGGPRRGESDADFEARVSAQQGFNTSDPESLYDKLYNIASSVPQGVGRIWDALAPADKQQPASLYADRVRSPESTAADTPPDIPPAAAPWQVAPPAVQPDKPTPATAARSTAPRSGGVAPKAGSGLAAVAGPEPEPVTNDNPTAEEDAINQLESLSPLQKQLYALNEKAQANAQGAYDRSNSRLQSQGGWADLLDRISQQGGSSSLRALAGGNSAYRADEKQRTADIDNLQTASESQQNLLQAANVKMQIGDSQGAYKLILEAQKIDDARADKVKKNELTDAQIEFYKPKTDALLAKAALDGRKGMGTGMGAVKPIMTETAYQSMINRKTSMLLASSKAMGSPIDYATAEALILKKNPRPTAAGLAAGVAQPTAEAPVTRVINWGQKQ